MFSFCGEHEKIDFHLGYYSFFFRHSSLAPFSRRSFGSKTYSFVFEWLPKHTDGRNSKTKWRNNQNRTKQREKQHTTIDKVKGNENKLNKFSFDFSMRTFSTFVKLFHLPHKVKEKTISVSARVVYFRSSVRIRFVGYSNGQARPFSSPYYHICSVRFCREQIYSFYSIMFIFCHFFWWMISMHFRCSFFFLGESFIRYHENAEATSHTNLFHCMLMPTWLEKWHQWVQMCVNAKHTVGRS